MPAFQIPVRPEKEKKFRGMLTIPAISKWVFAATSGSFTGSCCTGGGGLGAGVLDGISGISVGIVGSGPVPGPPAAGGASVGATKDDAGVGVAKGGVGVGVTRGTTGFSMMGSVFDGTLVGSLKIQPLTNPSWKLVVTARGANRAIATIVATMAFLPP